MQLTRAPFEHELAGLRTRPFKDAELELQLRAAKHLLRYDAVASVVSGILRLVSATLLLYARSSHQTRETRKKASSLCFSDGKTFRVPLLAGVEFSIMFFCHNELPEFSRQYVDKGCLSQRHTHIGSSCARAKLSIALLFRLENLFLKTLGVSFEFPSFVVTKPLVLGFSCCKIATASSGSYENTKLASLERACRTS